MSYRLHTNNMSWWLPVFGRNGVGRLTQTDEPLSPLVHMDVPSSVALYIHVLSYCRMLRLVNTQASTIDLAEMNIRALSKNPRHIALKGWEQRHEMDLTPILFLSLLACGWYSLSAYQACNSLEDGSHCVASRLDAKTTMDNRFNIHFSVI